MNGIKNLVNGSYEQLLKTLDSTEVQTCCKDCKNIRMYTRIMSRNKNTITFQRKKIP